MNCSNNSQTDAGHLIYEFRKSGNPLVVRVHWDMMEECKNMPNINFAHTRTPPPHPSISSCDLSIVEKNSGSALCTCTTSPMPNAWPSAVCQYQSRNRVHTYMQLLSACSRNMQLSHVQHVNTPTHTCIPATTSGMHEPPTQ